MKRANVYEKKYTYEVGSKLSPDILWLFDLTDGHWECEKHAVNGCLCKALFREEGATNLQNGETLKQSGYQVLL